MLPSPTLPDHGHPQGEPNSSISTGQIDTFPIATAGGIFHVRYDPEGKASDLGGVVPFAQFLNTSGLFAQWVSEAPVVGGSNRAHDNRDVLGSVLLSVLNGHYRFAHIAALRGDQVVPGLLGMGAVVSEDTVRRKLKKLVASPEAMERTSSWLRRHQIATLGPLLEQDWVMDVDVTIKPVYGFQPGSVVGYNPQKPGRPSHALHTFVMARTRLVLEVAVHPGNEHGVSHTIPDFKRVLGELPRHQWPKLVRGDCAFGTEDMMAWPEANGLDYLFKQRMTTRTKALVQELDLTSGWVEFKDGWQAKESTLQLSTLIRSRRVIVLRRKDPGPRYRRAKDVAPAKAPKQEIIDACKPYLMVNDDGFEYQVLVTSLNLDLPALAQLYRDRADVENVFDEIKNHWGWGGFTSHTFDVTKTIARMVALFYNWWSIFCRLVDPDHHREAITTRPALLHSVVRQTNSGGQRILTITSTNGDKHAIANILTKLGTWLRDFTHNAEQWTNAQRWRSLLQWLFQGPFGTLTVPTG